MNTIERVPLLYKHNSQSDFLASLGWCNRPCQNNPDMYDYPINVIEVNIVK